ncbi:MAG: hypothetical protein FH761_17770 [Firmicutes bacterium]|nr:hypothetical protein [Bacillota bacterium]
MKYTRVRLTKQQLIDADFCPECESYNIDQAEDVELGKITSKSPKGEEVTTKIMANKLKSIEKVEETSQMPKISSPYDGVPIHRALEKYEGVK